MELKVPTIQCNHEGQNISPRKRPSSVTGSVSATIPFVPVTHAAINSECVNE